MIPFAIFLIIWLIFLAIFIILSLLTILQMLRYGLAHWVTKATTIAFITISAGVVLGVLIFLSRTDLTAGLDLGVIFGGITNVNPL